MPQFLTQPGQNLQISLQFWVQPCSGRSAALQQGQLSFPSSWRNSDESAASYGRETLSADEPQSKELQKSTLRWKESWLCQHLDIPLSVYRYFANGQRGARCIQQNVSRNHNIYPHLWCAEKKLLFFSLSTCNIPQGRVSREEAEGPTAKRGNCIGVAFGFPIRTHCIWVPPNMATKPSLWKLIIYVAFNSHEDCSHIWERLLPCREHLLSWACLPWATQLPPQLNPRGRAGEGVRTWWMRDECPAPTSFCLNATPHFFNLFSSCSIAIETHSEFVFYW